MSTQYIKNNMIKLSTGKRLNNKSSVSPKSLSTNDNSFEKENLNYKLRDDPDELFETLLGYFDHQVLTPFYNDMGQQSPVLDEVRRIFGYDNEFNEQQYYLSNICQGFQDLAIDENKIIYDPRTTLMIKNIPRTITPILLIQELDLNYKNQYDFIYMPYDNQMNINSGYAFVNFKTPQMVHKFYLMYNCKGWITFQKEKPCILRYARQQGKRDLINQLFN